MNRLTTQQIQDHLKRVTYKPGWKFTVYEGDWEGTHLVITTVVPDAYDQDKMTVIDVHSVFPYLETIEQLDRWMMDRLGRMELHEMREFYRVDGVPVSDPHSEEGIRDSHTYKPEEA